MGRHFQKKLKARYFSTITSAPGEYSGRGRNFWVLRSNVGKLRQIQKILNTSPDALASTLAPFLVDDRTDIASVSAETFKISRQLAKPNTNWVMLADKVSDNLKKILMHSALKGLVLVQKQVDFIQKPRPVAQLLGFVGKDTDGSDIGYFGLEGYYNLPLSGKPGFVGPGKRCERRTDSSWWNKRGFGN